MKPAILVVDDDPDVLGVVCRILRSGGYEPVGVRSAERALQVLEQIEPRLVLLDVWLTGMDGLELLGRLRARGGAAARIPVVAMTGDDVPEGAAFDGVLLKPFEREELLGFARAFSGR